MQERDDAEREGHGDDRRRRVADPAVERRLDQLRDRGLAEEADRQRGERDPDLRGRDVLVDVIELLERDLRPPVALVGEALHPRGPRPDDRELGRDEVPVDEHEDEDEEEEDDRGHRPSPASTRMHDLPPAAAGRSLAPGGSAEPGTSR